MREVDPNTTPRAQAFALWMQAPMPMVTLLKTLDVTALVRRNRKQGLKFNGDGVSGEKRLSDLIQ